MERIANNAGSRIAGRIHRVTKSVGIAVQAAILGFRQAYSQGDTFDSIMGYVDTVTNIPNRRAYERDKPSYGKGYALVMIDIDNLKKINDTNGHLFGDAVLRRLAAIVDSAVGSEGRAYRVGGDEFAFVIPRQSVSEVCNSICANVRKEDSFTVSVGAVLIEDRGLSDHVVHLADMALYESKNRGRNTITTVIPSVAA